MTPALRLIRARVRVFQARSYGFFTDMSVKRKGVLGWTFWPLKRFRVRSSSFAKAMKTSFSVATTSLSSFREAYGTKSVRLSVNPENYDIGLGLTAELAAP